MANIIIPFLVSRTNKSGVTTWYWQPSAALAKAGWKSLPLGTDESAAVDAARKRNAEVEAWRLGGERPREVKRFVKASTVAALIKHYKDAGWPRLSNMDKPIADNTRSMYAAAFAKIERWAGDFAVTTITPERVTVFRKALQKACSPTVAYNTLAVGRTLFRYGGKVGLCAKANPFADFGLVMPDPRQQIWDEDGSGKDIAAFTAGAAAIGCPELGLAVTLFEHLGQREDDMLKLGEHQWREVKNLPREEHDILANQDGPDAGKVMGFFVRQGKTQRWVGVPIAGELRRRVEAQIARNRARDIPVTTILVNESTGRAWSTRRFIEQFTRAKAHAVATLRAEIADKRLNDYEAADHLASLQIRDLRRTAVVRMGELNLEDALIAAITGHKLGTIKKILETYMPRTTKMAARAIVARMADHRANERKPDAQQA